MTQIPGPPGLPVVGNIGDLDVSNTAKSYNRLADEYGDVFRLNVLGRNTVIVNTQELANELCDEKRFYKRPTGALEQVRNGVGDGLFTAFEEEENWGIAHRVLMPSFGPFAIKGMFEEMHEIAAQMVSRLARQGQNQAMEPADQFTRVALDSIALCAMDTRFNSFYRFVWPKEIGGFTQRKADGSARDDMHPFIAAMGFFLSESGQRSFRPAFVSDYVYRASTRKYWESIELMKNTARQAIEERRVHPSSKKDLLAAMLEGKDPKTGRGMSDDSIIKNAITFLIAG